MQNLLKAFAILSFLVVVSCSKEPLPIPQTMIEKTISSRSSLVVEMDVQSTTYNSDASELEVILVADGDFSEVILEASQTLELLNNSSISLSVVSFSGNDGSLHIVFSIAQDPPSGLVSVQEIIIEDEGFE